MFDDADHSRSEEDHMRVHYAQAVYGREEIDAATAVLENQPLQLMTGPNVDDFQSRIAALFAKRHGLMVNSGSSANLVAVGALALPSGSEVITPALTFSTTVAPLVQNGLVPAFVDVEPGTYNIDAGRIESMIGPKTRAVMIPNLIGNLPDWVEIRKLADTHDLIVIEDSADTVGAKIDGAPAGRFTDISTTSFYASHVITAAGFGGMVSVNDPDVLRRALLLRGWGRASSALGESEATEDRFGIEVDGIEYDAKFEFPVMGYNFLPSEISAAFGLKQLDRLEEFSQRRIDNFARLMRFFSEYADWFILPRQRPEVRTPWLAFPLTVRSVAPFTRRELQEAFEAADIQTRVIFTGNILRQSGFRDIERRESADGYPHTDDVMRGGILIGCHHGLEAAQLGHIEATFEAFAAAWR